jgi:hypothetical protein
MNATTTIQLSTLPIAQKKPAIRLQQAQGAPTRRQRTTSHSMKSVTVQQQQQQQAMINRNNNNRMIKKKQPKTFQRNINQLTVKVPPADMLIPVKPISVKKGKFRFLGKLKSYLEMWIPN